MGENFIPISQTDLQSIQSILNSGERLYRAYDIALKYVPNSSDQRFFWFQEASKINRFSNGFTVPADDNLASTYIVAHSNFGLALDSNPKDMRTTSNGIATEVIGHILSGGGIQPLDAMLRADVFRALQVGEQSPGGWGGAFYYWDLEIDLSPLGYSGSTLGEIISSNPVDYEKFIASSAVATLAVLEQELAGVTSFAEVWKVLETGATAAVPFEVKQEIALRVVDALNTGQVFADFSSFGVWNSSTGVYQDWVYDPVSDEFYWDVPRGTAGGGERIQASGELEQGLRERLRYRLSAEEKDLDYVDEVLDKIRLKPELCFLAGTPVSRADGTPTNIEDVRIGDMVTAYDRDGNLVPGRVSAVHCNQVDHILDVHGLMVTPGHVTLCGDGPYANKHVPIIDILRTDGALVREDGTKVRAATGSQLGDPDDHMVWAITGETQADGSTKVLDKGQIRLGTRVILSDGADVSVGELITRAGGQVNDKGLIVHEAGGTNMPFVWVFGDRLPRPEDYVLQRSGLSLMDLYDGAGRPTSDLSMHQ